MYIGEKMKFALHIYFNYILLNTRFEKRQTAKATKIS